MSKRNNLQYIKPADPKFLRQIKEQIGYKEGPSIESKRQRLETDFDSSDSEEEFPQVVVLKKGDLTAEEAKIEQKRVEEEEEKKPADLNQRIIFKSNKKSNNADIQEKGKIETKEKHSKKKTVKTNKLSFQEDLDEQEEYSD